MECYVRNKIFYFLMPSMINSALSYNSSLASGYYISSNGKGQNYYFNYPIEKNYNLYGQIYYPFIEPTDPNLIVSGTQKVVVTPDDWGCPVTATVIKLDKKIDADSVAKTDFVVTENKQGYAQPKEREVIDAYVL